MKKTTKISLRNHAMGDQAKQDHVINKSSSNDGVRCDYCNGTKNDPDNMGQTEFPCPACEQMSKEQISEELKTLSNRMLLMAGQMEYYGGFSGWGQHGRELAGAAKTMAQWVVHIDSENTYGGI